MALNQGMKATGAGSLLNYAAETVEGVTPTTGTLKNINLASESLTATITETPTTDITRDGQVTGTTDNVRAVSGDITGQLHSGQLDDFLPALCGKSDWTPVSETSLAGTLTASGKSGTIVFTGTPDLSNLKPYMIVKIAGMSTAANNVDVLVLTVNDSTDTITVVSFENDLVTEATFTGVSLSGSYVSTGDGIYFGKTFAMERNYNLGGVEDQSVRYLGLKPSQAAINLEPNGGTNFTISMMGITKELANDSMLSANGWVVDGTTSAGSSTITLKSGSGTLTVDDRISFAGSSTQYKITDVSTLTLTLEPALTEEITDETVVYYQNMTATNPSVDTVFKNTLGYVLVGGVFACLKSLDISYNNGLTPSECVGSQDPTGNIEGIRQGTANFTMSKNANAQVIAEKMENRERIILFCMVTDTAGNRFAVLVPSGQFTNDEAKIDQGGELTQTIPVNALKSTSDEWNSYFVFQRLSA